MTISTSTVNGRYIEHEEYRAEHQECLEMGR